MSKDNIDAKLLIYVLTSSVLKVNPMYFTQDALDALASAEKELIQGLKDLDEGVTVNERRLDLVVTLI